VTVKAYGWAYFYNYASSFGDTGLPLYDYFGKAGTAKAYQVSHVEFY
jgi:hypothetical protein